MSTEYLTIPSPIPPWQRPVTSPLTQTLTEAGTIDVDRDVTYLELTTAPTSGDAHTAILPAGNYLRQIKRIYITKEYESTTAPWRVTGTFVGFTSLLFNTVGWAAVLEWVGDGWAWIGGNATQES